VAYADFSAKDVRPQLDRLARHSLVRGVRMQLHWHENPMFRFAARADCCDDPVIQTNIGRLADYGWSFDLQVFAAQMEGAVRLARSCPRVTFVLQHAGMPEDLSPEGRSRWRVGMEKLAAEPNVVSKLSGLGTFIHRNDAGHVADIVGETVRLFGADRCLFGSNFPIEKLWTNYADLVGGYRKATERLPPTEVEAIFAGTARRVYRL
jgi:predicted TIM-barrel fold metal-dependent hydrolase